MNKIFNDEYGTFYFNRLSIADVNLQISCQNTTASSGFNYNIDNMYSMFLNLVLVTSIHNYIFY